MNNTGIRISKQMYNFLLSFYPKSYRQEFGKEMQYVFSEQLTDSYNEGGEYGVLCLWGRTVIDAGKSLITQHIENQKGHAYMNKKNTNILIKNRDFLGFLLVNLGILSIPVIGKWPWTLSDFIVMGTLLFSFGLTFIFLMRKVHNTTHRILIGVGLLVAFLWLWAELAVGVFTNWGS